MGRVKGKPAQHYAKKAINFGESRAKIHKVFKGRHGMKLPNLKGAHAGLRHLPSLKVKLKHKGR